VSGGYFDNHLLLQQSAMSKGYWSQHYELSTNYLHEMNALYDVHHCEESISSIIDPLTGQYAPVAATVDPTVQTVSNFLIRLQPLYRIVKPILRPFYRLTRKILRSINRQGQGK
jgi:hypothetical protein